MSDAAYYRGEAQRCRELAASAPDSNVTRRWHQIADEYTILAEELAAHSSGRPPILCTAMQQQFKTR